MTTFYVYRTSQWDDPDEPPCEDCHRGTRRYIDQRTFASVAEHNAKLGAGWTDKGADHGTNDTGIYRYFEADAWLIDLESLDQLVALVQKHGECVVKAEQGSTPAIEIYDDYRE